MVDKCLIPGTPPLTQKLLIAWGKDDEQSISSDVWLLEINGHDCGSIKWRKVTVLLYLSCIWVSVITIVFSNALEIAMLLILLYSFPLKPPYSQQPGTQHNHITLMEYRSVL